MLEVFGSLALTIWVSTVLVYISKLSFLLKDFNEIRQIVEEFVAGEHYTLARIQNGKVFSFGRADYGQLDLENNILSTSRNSKAIISTPTAIPSFLSIKCISVRDHYSMVIDADNKVHSWEFGEYYVLGNKSEEDEIAPFQISDLKELEGRKNIV
ncbi:regulator of chromosome condensation isoform X2 [Rhizophagus clarus]|uniref:Regulator of chromosome condensation isoform X2 n=1 Tax=Rhizophagus clarus TaxID=94130 RepID=A0A8H3LT07_9GLOM|nr:regulator of chromosome condensation isoform X2 [Rhizophagus clarus]